MYKLLMIDDDNEMLEINAKNFTERGYDVRCAKTAKAGLWFLEAFQPDCILLDVMMPGIDGFETCKRIRKQSQVPIIFLTGRVSEDDKISGLLMGADDYMEKPYSLRELEARILVNIRRGAVSEATTSGNRLSFPPLEIDLISHTACCDGEDLGLSKQEFGILYFLASSGGTPVTYEQIGNRIWGSYRPEDRRSVMVNVSRLRKKLEFYPATARLIETVWSQGYRFTGTKGDT